MTFLINGATALVNYARGAAQQGMQPAPVQAGPQQPLPLDERLGRASINLLGGAAGAVVGVVRGLYNGGKEGYQNGARTGQNVAENTTIVLAAGGAWAATSYLEKQAGWENSDPLEIDAYKTTAAVTAALAAKKFIVPSVGHVGSQIGKFVMVPVSATAGAVRGGIQGTKSHGAYADTRLGQWFVNKSVGYARVPGAAVGRVIDRAYNVVTGANTHAAQETLSTVTGMAGPIIGLAAVGYVASSMVPGFIAWPVSFAASTTYSVVTGVAGAALAVASAGYRAYSELSAENAQVVPLHAEL